jgi:hypothetical protein
VQKCRNGEKARKTSVSVVSLLVIEQATCSSKQKG